MERIANLAGVCVWLIGRLSKADGDAHVVDAYVGESGNLDTRIGKYLAVRPGSATTEERLTNRFAVLREPDRVGRLAIVTSARVGDGPSS